MKVKQQARCKNEVEMGCSSIPCYNITHENNDTQYEVLYMHSPHTHQDRFEPVFPCTAQLLSVQGADHESDEK